MPTVAGFLDPLCLFFFFMLLVGAPLAGLALAVVVSSGVVVAAGSGVLVVAGSLLGGVIGLLLVGALLVVEGTGATSGSVSSEYNFLKMTIS